MAETSVTIRKDSPRKKKSHSSMSASFSECQSPASDAGMTMASSRIDNDGEEAADYQIVAAIDFGTTFSGYAYSFASNKQAIHVNKNWGQTQGIVLWGELSDFLKVLVVFVLKGYLVRSMPMAYVGASFRYSVCNITGKSKKTIYNITSCCKCDLGLGS